MTDPKRSFERIPVHTVTGTLRHPGDIRVLDLSRTGMAFATSERLEVGADYELELEYRHQSVKLAVIVRWVERQESERQEGAGEHAQAEPPGGGERHHVGAEFVTVLEKAPTGMWDWIQAQG